MEKHIVVDSIPSNYKFKYLGKGTNANSYLTSDGKCFKEFKTFGVYDEITESLLGLDYDGFVFPESYVFLGSFSKDTYKGMIKKYIEGTQIRDLNDAIKIREFISALKEFEDNVRDFSYDQALNLYDLNMGNLLYKEGRIIDIDTDCTCPFDRDDINPYFENIKELSNCMCVKFFDGVFNKSYINDIKRESLLIGCSRPSKVMSEILSEMSRYKEIDTLRDYNEGLKLIRK